MSLFLAATAQQKVGVGVAIATVVFAFFYVAVHLRRRESPPVGSEIELAPNRKPYFNDEELETRKLEKAQLFSFAMLALIAIGLPLYWVREPGRQAGADQGFENRAVNRGFSLFQPSDSPVHGAHFGCADCHGSVGQGGSIKVNITDPKTGKLQNVTWQAPALNDALRRFDKEEIRNILVYGRSNTPMPAWGILGGGPMNDQQIDDLVAYIASIQRPVNELRDENLKLYGTDGQKLFDAFCARCHTKGFSFGQPDERAGGAFGPSLIDGATVRQFPDRADHIDFITKGSEYAKPYGTRGMGGNEGGGMPGFAELLTPEQIAAIVDYERSL